jgi:hypothetical protein
MTAKASMMTALKAQIAPSTSRVSSDTPEL